MIKAQSMDERMLERLHAQGMETYSRDADPEVYEVGKFGEILGMVRKGASFEEVRDWYEGVKAQHEAPPVSGQITEDLYWVFMKVAKGDTADFSVYGTERERASGKVGEKRRRMLEMAAMGFTNAEIAEATGAALSTVKECVGGDDDAAGPGGDHEPHR